MTDAGLGQSTCIGIGGDPIIGTTFLDVLQLFAADEETEAIVLIGEIGGAAEETAAAWAAEHLAHLPKVAFIAGRTAPEGKRMGHAGAIISGGAGTAASKVEALEAAGFRVADSPTELPGSPPRRRLPRLTVSSSEVVAGWHDFYLTAGSASAALLGLAFVGVSVNVGLVTGDETGPLRDLAETAFSSLIFVLLISLFVLMPGAAARQQPRLAARDPRRPRPDPDRRADPSDLEGGHGDIGPGWSTPAIQSARIGPAGPAPRRLAPLQRSDVDGDVLARRLRPDLPGVGRRQRLGPADHGRTRAAGRLTMGASMDLVAGDVREILLVIGLDDLAAFDDRSRFHAHLALGGGLDPTWLDLFAEAARTVTGLGEPPDLIDARFELDGPEEVNGERTIERVDPAWISAVARVPDASLDPLAGRWIDLIEEELGELPREEKPWIRHLAGQVVLFCRAADRAPDVLFVWALT